MPAKQDGWPRFLQGPLPEVHKSTALGAERTECRSLRQLIRASRDSHNDWHLLEPRQRNDLHQHRRL